MHQVPFPDSQSQSVREEHEPERAPFMRVKASNFLGNDPHPCLRHVVLVSAHYLDKVACLKDYLSPSVWTPTAHYTSIAITRSLVVK